MVTGFGVDSRVGGVLFESGWSGQLSVVFLVAIKIIVLTVMATVTNEGAWRDETIA